MPAALAVKFLQSEWDREAVSGLKHRWSGGGGGSRTRVRESLPSKGYVRFRFGGCRPPHWVPARRGGLARLNPAFGSRRKPWTYSCKMTPSGRVQAHRPRAATYKLGSESKLLIGSFRFPIVLRELGTRHDFP